MKKLILLLVLIITSCHHVHDGYIESKYSESAHQVMYSQIHQVGKTSYTTWHTRYVPERFYMTVRGKDE